MGAPLGNTNKQEGRSFAGALRRTLYEAGTDRERLLTIANVLVTKAEEGDMQAIKEVADRLDGKPAQTVDVGNKDGEPFKSKVTVEFVGSAPGGVPLPVATQG